MIEPYDLNNERDSAPHAFYQHALSLLKRAGVPFLLGGAYAFEHYTGIVRRTKDLDIFLRPADCPAALAALAPAGYQTELVSPVWLAKARSGDYFIDIIFSSANGIARVDDDWFTHAAAGRLLNDDILVCAPEEIIWSKGFIMNRDRFDGADIAHLLRVTGQHIDWERLLNRFGANWRVLFSHLTLFGYIYPNEREAVPMWVMDDLLGRLTREVHSPVMEPRICRGTDLSMNQYLIDVQQWGYADGRVKPFGALTPADVATLIADE